MDLIFFEDFREGAVDAFGDYPVTREEVIAYAREFDPQPFHLDEEAARRSMLGRLSASGWHTAAMTMRLMFDAFLYKTASIGGMGIEELKWSKPVLVGDRLSCRRTVLEKREMRSHRDRGILRLRFEAVNQNGDVAMSHTGLYLVGRRGAPPLPPGAIRPRPDAAAAPAEPWTAEPRSMAAFFEDLTIGSGNILGEEVFTRDKIRRFATAFDPQYFHVDEDAAAKSHFGGLVASGWHTGACFMRHLTAFRDARVAEARARGEAVPEPAPSPGFRDLKWRQPVYAGDTIRYASVVRDKRKTSRPGWGLVFAHNTGTNQHGAVVFAYQSAVFWQMKP